VSERRTDDATLIEAVRILARDIQSGDGCANACLLEAAARLQTLVEERRSISTLLGKVETLEADNERLREERRWIPVGERLPDSEEWVDVAGLWGESLGWHEPSGWHDIEDSGLFLDAVTHWRNRGPGPEANG
jgi:hypothetical protein